MSGSKHTTWKDAKKALEAEKTCNYNFDAAFKKTNTVYRELESKHFIKKKTIQLRKERKENTCYKELPNNKFYNYDVMPFERKYRVEQDSIEGAAFPIDEEDIVSIINKLPASMTYMLKLIKITLDKRDKQEMFPGIWLTGRLGTTYSHKNKIDLFGYEIKESYISLIKPLLFYLKVVGMGTLVHELAHHYDFTLTYSRKGKYEKIKEYEREEYAQYAERDLYLDAVCPYIKEKYNVEALCFAEWMKSIKCLPLDFRYFDPGLTNHLDYFILSDFFWQFFNGADSYQLNLTLARELHWAGEINIAKNYIDYILNSNANYSEALRLKAHMLFHEEDNIHGAEAVYKKLLTLLPNDPGVYTDYALLKKKAGEGDEAVRLIDIALSLGKEGDNIKILNKHGAKD